ncbi:hypothetical protein DND132_1954 [Pseudodesulfovibrio mercurii]|uniref:Uncharacterized protein n=1 Tax=Pseudodesulfovibrio mercurii TaxID=641491 RepID=F0JGX0_9BACT|nr:hypothetical protein [Pseudodesulfovibrio mercurii]EGB15160.1 hypothetical protein DND132_1954 [Pseudodesulfovibrio mercurii]
MGNTASPQMFQQGLSLFDDVTDFLGERNSEKGASDRAEARAGLIETDAAGTAHDLRRRAEQDAARLREDREHSRSLDNARWGGSGLAMSGSTALVRDANRLKDRQDEEDVLVEGERNARSALNSARNQANMLRINEGGSADRSILSLGSKIYGRSRA